MIFILHGALERSLELKTIDTKLNEPYDGEIKPGDGEIDKPPPTKIWQKLHHFVGEIGSFIIID